MNHQRTVFVVDDEPTVLRAISRLLSLEGFKVERFSSGRQFIDKYDPSRGGCLVLDVMMPELTGLEVQERLIGSGISIPIIFLTGKDESEVRVEALKRGAVAFLIKPVTARQLMQSIEKAFVEGQKDGLGDQGVHRSGIVVNRA